jgi:Ca-activated chloride channel family protein
MKYLITAVFFILCVAEPAFTQSGRKVKAPAPASSPAIEAPADRSEYSESSPTTGPSYSRKRSKAQADTPKTVVPSADNKASGDEDVIRVSTDLVTVPVSVFERSGVYVSGLRRNDFKVFDNGKEQEIAYFGNNEVPFSLVLLIDTSGSTDSKIRDIQNAALEFVGNLLPADKVMVMQFSDGLDTLCDFTSDRAAIEKAIRKVSGGGGTNLYRAVENVLKKKQLITMEGRKAVVLFTDGVDTYDNESGFEKSLAVAEEGDAIVYTAYYNTFLSMRGIGGAGPMSGIPDLSVPRVKGMRAEDYNHGRLYLEELARVTGGKMFRSEQSGLGAALDGIANDLGNQYVIGFYPGDSGQNGEKRSLKVRVNRPAVAIRARDSYIAGAVDTGKPSK